MTARSMDNDDEDADGCAERASRSSWVLRAASSSAATRLRSRAMRTVRCTRKIRMKMSKKNSPTW